MVVVLDTDVYDLDDRVGKVVISRLTDVTIPTTRAPIGTRPLHSDHSHMTTASGHQSKGGEQPVVAVASQAMATDSASHGDLRACFQAFSALLV
jgi:hypothetical protein